MGKAALALVLALLPSAALATTDAASLQAIGQAAAAQYGVPWSIFEAQIQGESSWNPNIGNSPKGAEGIAQFLPSTAASLGVNPYDPTSALYGAAQYDQQLYQQTGSWTGALTRYTGGLSPGNTGGNVAYGQAFAAAQQIDAGSTGVASTGSGASSTAPGGAFTTMPDGIAQANGFPTSGSSGGSATLPAVNSTPGALLLPFTWMYNQVIAVTQQEVTGDISAVQVMVGHYLLPLVTLAFVALLLRMLFGRYLIDHAAAWVAKLAIVVPLVVAGSTLYTQFVVEPVFGFPQWWQGYISTPAAGQFSADSPAAPFDKVYASTAATEQAIWSETHGLINDVRNAAGLLGAKLLIVLSLGALFLPFAILTLLSMVAVILGPVVIPFALFQRTAFFFWGWVWATASILLSLLAIDIVLAMYANVMNALIQSMSVTGTADNDMTGFWSAALVMVLLGFSAAYVPALVTRISNGVSVSMGAASHYMSAGPLRSFGSRIINAPSNLIRRWMGM